MSEVALVVNGKRYGGWKSVSITRSIESIAGSFELEVSDRWSGDEDPWPIAEEDECRVEIDEIPVIDGYIGRRRISASKEARTLSYPGIDRAAELVECSAVLKKWTYRNITLADFATVLAQPFDIKVTVQAGLTLSKVPKIVVSPGDTVYETLKPIAETEGVLLVSDGVGGIAITRAGSTRAASLIEGQNILEASVEYESSDRFSRYIVMTQTAGTDEASADATRIQAEATDAGVRRTHRALIIRPDKGLSVADARRRADWNARVRAARAETITVSVQGWTQTDGTLWPLNALTRVKAPRAIGVEGDLLISQIDHTVGEGGQVTQLRLVRPDAFTPEPTKAVVKSSEASGAWKELKRGAL